MIDSGSDVNIIGGSDWEILEHQLQNKLVDLNLINLPQNQELRAYAVNKPMPVRHAFKAHIEVVGMTKPTVLAEFLVVAKGRRSLLGRSTASEMRLLEVGVAVNNCENSSGTGVFPKNAGN